MSRPNMFSGAGRVIEVIVRIPEDRLTSLRTLAAYYGTDVPSFMRYLSFERLDEFEKDQATKRRVSVA